MNARTSSIGTLNMVAVLLAVLSEAAFAGELHASVRDAKGQPVEHAVVLAMPVNKRLIEAPKPGRIVVDQINKEFVPYVLPVYVGSLVYLPNKDNIRHHVYSFSPAKKFELPLYSGTAAPPVMFDSPGVVVLGCNIHDWMIGYVYVADTPFFAKTGKDGLAAIKSLPGGEYLVRIWHPDMAQAEQATEKRIALGAEIVKAEWLLSLKPAFRIQRPIGGQGAAYR